MKKLLAVILLISFCLTMLVGCDGCAGFYRVEVTGSKDSLMKPLKSFYRAGTVVQIKAHPVTDVTLHIYVNGEQIAMTHFDSDYWGYEFVMPAEDVTVHLTYDPFYGREEYTFEELTSATDCLEYTVNKVSIRTTQYTEAHSLIETRYSTKQEDIDAFLAIFEEGLVKADNGEASGASCGMEYTFYYVTPRGEGSATIRFQDDFFIWTTFSDWRSFAFKDEEYTLPTIENPDLVTYSFNYDGLSSDIRKYGDESFAIRYFLDEQIEFVPYVTDGQVDLDFEPVYYVDSRYGEIALYTQSVFEWNETLYKIVAHEEYWAYAYCPAGDKT